MMGGECEGAGECEGRTSRQGKVDEGDEEMAGKVKVVLRVVHGMARQVKVFAIFDGKQRWW